MDWLSAVMRGVIRMRYSPIDGASEATCPAESRCSDW